MEQVKIFSGLTGAVETQVNSWLKENGDRISIIGRKLSSIYVPSYQCIHVIIAIFYTDKH